MGSSSLWNGHTWLLNTWNVSSATCGNDNVCVYVITFHINIFTTYFISYRHVHYIWICSSICVCICTFHWIYWNKWNKLLNLILPDTFHFFKKWSHQDILNYTCDSHYISLDSTALEDVTTFLPLGFSDETHFKYKGTHRLKS